MSHIGIHKTKRSQNKILNISTLRSDFLKLNAQLKKFGRTKCKFYKNQCCNHSTMGYGGISRDTDCKIGNCPLIIN